MLATITGNALLSIEQDEAAKLAQAMQRVARHYDIPGMSQQTIDWISLIQTCGAIYGSRIMAARMNNLAERAAKPAPAPKPEPIRPNPSKPMETKPAQVVTEVPGLGEIVVEMPGAYKQ